jgi:glycosyltransferase involved in cell wall biosynthesis
MTASRLAFVVATKDRPEELRRLWESLLAQTLLPDEVVVVEAGPSLSPLQAPPSGRPVLRRVASPVASAARQRNAGIDAVGPAIDLVGFLDDDAVLEENAVAEIVRLFSEFGPELGGAAFNMTNHPPLALAALKRTTLAEALDLYARRRGAVTRSGFQTMIGRVEATGWADWLPTTAAVWRREIFRGHRFDEWYSGYSYLEDLDFSYRVGRVYRLAVAASARYRHLPAEGGRGDGFAFGLREVLNRVHFVRKHSELSVARCRAALALRLAMSLAAAVRERAPDHLARAWGNVVGLARSFIPERTGRAAILVYGQVPPPRIGSNIMTAHFLAAVRKAGREAVLSRKSLSSGVAEVNRVRPAKLFRLLATWGRFAGNIRRVRPSLAVVFASSTLLGLLAETVVVGLCRLHRVPYVLYLHTDVHRRIGAAPLPVRPVLAAVFRSAAAVIVLGRAFRDEIASGRMGPPGGLFVLPNCVDDPAGPDGAGPRDGALKILFLSTIEESKGVMTLLRAVPLVLAEAPGTAFSVVGPWKGRAIRDAVEGFIAANALEKSVAIEGEADAARKSRLLAGHDVFVLPSRREAQSLAVLEAMRASLPVVATDVGAMAEAVDDGVTGYLVPPDDPVRLAERVLRLARDASLRSAMGRAGRKRYESEFAPAVYEKNVQDVLTRVMDGSAHR